MNWLRRKFFYALRLCGWHWPASYGVIHRFLCPRPAGDYDTARSCIKAGHCGCDNGPAIKAKAGEAA